MFSFLSIIAVLLAGVTLSVCSPVVDMPETGTAGETTDSFNVASVVDSLTKLTKEQIKAIKPPLQELATNFKNTLFGSLFSYVLYQVQTPAERTQKAEELEKFNKPFQSSSFISAIRQLPEQVIARSQPQFEILNEILGESPLGRLFQEISMILSARSDLLEFVQMEKVLPLDMIDKQINSGSQQLSQLPTKVAEALSRVDPGSAIKNLRTRVGTKVAGETGLGRTSTMSSRVQESQPRFQLRTSGAGSITI